MGHLSSGQDGVYFTIRFRFVASRLQGAFEISRYFHSTLRAVLNVTKVEQETEHSNLYGPHSSAAENGDVGASEQAVPPMTWTLMGRFFAVPFLIISVIVSGAILVVFLFGGPASPEHRSIEDLLKGLESTSGQRSAGVLLPREKELWQMALELSLRLEKKDRELTPEELTQTARRLAAMVEAEVLAPDAGYSTRLDSGEAAVRSRRLEFLIHALGRTEQPGAVAPLRKIVDLNREPYVAAAVQEIGNLHTLPEARAAVGDITRLVFRSPRPETAMVAATALSVLATPGDPAVVDALKSLMFAQEGEVAWSAAVSLARLGDASGRTILMDMLDRAFWESGDRFQKVDESGEVRRYPMPPQRIEALLIAAIDAAAHLPDETLWDAIETLKSDPIPNVRTKAAEVASRRTTPAANG